MKYVIQPSESGEYGREEIVPGAPAINEAGEEIPGEDTKVIRRFRPYVLPEGANVYTNQLTLDADSEGEAAEKAGLTVLDAEALAKRKVREAEIAASRAAIELEKEPAA